MMGYTYFSERQRASFDAWFASASDDDRAECVIAWNYGLGGGIETLQSIVERPDCDLTTALTIFWSSDAILYLAKYPNEQAAKAAGEGDLYKLLASIIHRYRESGFAHSGLKLDMSDIGGRVSITEKLADHDDLAAPPTMASSILGRPPVRTTEFDMYGVPMFIAQLDDPDWGDYVKRTLGSLQIDLF
ncbi:DUF4274 domain-containing protein [Sphingobium vermicomposti]|uniref:DUF4274 domain-containing protein n=1 Tax=Sphingobium vermicomposti TaxID=529005 RepID=A0A846M8G8_9SPHN|nr:DUF4274 domain-containing protein [Sphingobium vermicomposti]NIJ18162.1 hypothetical protein [Sphingobium vermicomposti]